MHVYNSTFQEEAQEVFLHEYFCVKNLNLNYDPGLKFERICILHENACVLSYPHVPLCSMSRPGEMVMSNGTLCEENFTEEI